MKLPVCVYSALNGMQWLTAPHETLRNRTGVRKMLGELPDFNIERGYRGLLVKGNVCYIYACFCAKQFDNVGRDAVYFIFTWIPTVSLDNVDIGVILSSEAFNMPRKEWDTPALIDVPNLLLKSPLCEILPDLENEPIKTRISYEGSEDVWEVAKYLPANAELRLHWVEDSDYIRVDYTPPSESISKQDNTPSTESALRISVCPTVDATDYVREIAQLKRERKALTIQLQTMHQYVAYADKQLKRCYVTFRWVVIGIAIFSLIVWLLIFWKIFYPHTYLQKQNVNDAMEECNV